MQKPRIANYAIAHIAAFIILSIGICTPHIASASDPVKVMVMPFEVHATGELNYLKTQIADVLSDHLEKDGAKTVPYTAARAAIDIPTVADEAAIRRTAAEYGVDRIIWGSFTLIGEKFSLDAFMLAPYDTGGARSFNVQGTKLENLLKVLKSLSVQIGLKLFEYQLVEEIRIEGNKRIEADAIKRQVQTKAGSRYKDSQLSSDLKAIFKMGYFDDLRVETSSGAKGKIVTFHVIEKPTVRRIKFKGNIRFDDEKINADLLHKLVLKQLESDLNRQGF